MAKQLEIKSIPIYHVYFDIENQRSKFDNFEEHPSDIFDERMHTEIIPSLLSSVHGDGASYSVNSLKESIRSSGGIVTPVWLKKVDEKYVCIEGNTRLLIYKELFSESEAEVQDQWSRIPAIVYENLSSEEEHKLKLTAHIVGTRDWKPYSKAKYVTELLESSTFGWDEICDIVGGRKSDLFKLSKAQKRHDEYYLPLTNDKSQFSHYIESENEKVSSALENNGFTQSDFANWVADNKLPMAINVRKLPKILQMPEAKKAFLSGGFKEAEKYIVSASQTVDLQDVSEYSLIDELCQRLEDMDPVMASVDKKLIKKIVQLVSTGSDILTSLPSESKEEHFGQDS